MILSLATESSDMLDKLKILSIQLKYFVYI